MKNYKKKNQSPDTDQTVKKKKRISILEGKKARFYRAQNAGRLSTKRNNGMSCIFGKEMNQGNEAERIFTWTSTCREGFIVGNARKSCKH